jgi:hypothetical protein
LGVELRLRPLGELARPLCVRQNALLVALELL